MTEEVVEKGTEAAPDLTFVPEVAPENITKTAFEQRMEDAKVAANDAFWAKVAEAFPETTTGDFPPDAAFVWNSTMEYAIKIWVELNAPEAANLPQKEEVEEAAGADG